MSFFFTSINTRYPYIILLFVILIILLGSCVDSTAGKGNPPFEGEIIGNQYQNNSIGFSIDLDSGYTLDPIKSNITSLSDADPDINFIHLVFQKLPWSFHDPEFNVQINTSKAGGYKTIHKRVAELNKDLIEWYEEDYKQGLISEDQLKKQSVNNIFREVKDLQLDSSFTNHWNSKIYFSVSPLNIKYLEIFLKKRKFFIEIEMVYFNEKDANMIFEFLNTVKLF